MSRDTILSGVLPIGLGVLALTSLLVWELLYVAGRRPGPRFTAATGALVVVTIVVIAARFVAYA